jgi:predicted GNAT family acetyltransferase
VPGTLVDNTANHRFELAEPGGTAFVDYRRSGSTLILVHAEVPASLRGGGFGARLVRETLELIRSRGETIVPACPYVRSFVDRHQEFADLVRAP